MANTVTSAPSAYELVQEYRESLCCDYPEDCLCDDPQEQQWADKNRVYVY